MPALDSLRPSLQTVLDESLATHGVPGAVVGVQRGDERIVVASGVANVGTGVETTPDTLFQIGAISKVYTATLVLQLVHAGLVELDEPVRGALQEFRVKDDTATLTITPRQLLSHTSGIQCDHFLDCGRNPDALWRYVSTLDDVGQLHDPDDMFSYCNAGYGVLGRLVEEATGDHYARALQRRLLRPLALEHTVTQAEQAILHRVAAGHHHHGPGETATVAPWVLSRFNAPVGGIIASAEDVLTFAGMHLHGGKSAEGRQVVPTKAITEMCQGEVEVPGTDDEWGLGWWLTHWGDQRVLGHDGDTAGQRAFLRVLPEAEGAVIVLTNSTRGTPVADDVLAHAGKEAFGCAPPAPPEPLPTGEGPEPDRYTGIYERMHQRLAIAGGRDATLRMTIIPDELFVQAGMRERTLTLHPVDDHRFVTLDPETLIRHLVVMVGADEDGEGSVPYVHFQRRAHARIG
jgi:CubicO group peptidase (beta-lactamase class C family)